MRCPFCKTSTFRKVVAGEREIDRCTACGALWFDAGHLRELTEGNLPPGPDGEPPSASPGKHGAAEKPGAILSRARREAASLFCPRCEGPLSAIDFQMTGIPVFRCPACRGVLAARASAGEIAARFRFAREHEAQFAALGETLAREEKRRMEKRWGPVGGGTPAAVPLPVVVPLADESPDLRSFPVATFFLIGLAAALYVLAQVRGARLPLPGGLPALPSGTGFAGVSKLSLLLAPFLQDAILPLATGSLFLYVLGDNVEDRMGSTLYFLFYLFCGVCAGSAHVLWGRTGGPPALASSGAVAGILGAYLVFFPDVSIRMYGMGRIVALPAYLFACAWVVAAFLLEWRSGPLAMLLFPAALSLPGSLAGFGSGVAGALVFRMVEESGLPRRRA